jgi:hypothetical protein
VEVSLVDDVPDWQRKEEKPEHFESMYEALEIILSIEGSKMEPKGWGGGGGGGGGGLLYLLKLKYKLIIARYMVRLTLMAIALEVQGWFDTFPCPKLTSRSTRLNGTGSS